MKTEFKNNELIRFKHVCSVHTGSAEVTKEIHESTRSLKRDRRLLTKTAQTLKPKNKPNVTC